MIPYTFHDLRKAMTAGKKKAAPLLGTALGGEYTRSLRTEPHVEKLLAEIREEADRAKREPVPPLPFSQFQLFSSAGTRLEYERPYFDRRGRLLALALVTVIDDTSDYIEALENLIWDICGEYAWSLPAHLPSTMESVQLARVAPEHVVDLFAAETSHALAETLYMVGDKLHPWVVHRVKGEIERRVFRPIFDTPYRFGWESSTNNWSAVCAGAAGMAAMLLIDDPERLAGMTDRLIRAMGGFLQGYGEDGCCPEGIGYWNYGFGYYVYFAEMLYELTGGSIDLLAGEKLRQIAAFPAAVALTAPVYVNYSDSGERHVPHTGLHSRLHRRLGVRLPEMSSVPSLHSDHCYRFPHTVRNLIWTEPAFLNQPAAMGTFFFPDTAWIVDKRDARGGMLAFSAKGGHNDEPHNQNDLGHFILHAGGESLLADLGAGVYTKDYFGAKRYTFLHNASEGHSVPIVGGYPQAAGRQREARLIRNERIGETLYYSLDMTKAYPEEAGLQSLIRLFEWSPEPEQGSARLMLTDKFVFSSGTGAMVEEVFMSFHLPELDAGRVLWNGMKGQVALHYEEVEFDAQLDVIPSRKHSAESVNIYRVRLKHTGSSGQAECRLRFDCSLKP